MYIGDWQDPGCLNKRAVRIDQSNNGTGVHANKTFHDILWDSAEVLKQETNWTKQRLGNPLNPSS
jgi:hypothetical protein